MFNRRSTDTFAGSMTDRVRRTLDGLDNHLSRLGRIGSTAALTAMAAGGIPPGFNVITGALYEKDTAKIYDDILSGK